MKDKLIVIIIFLTSHIGLSQNVQYYDQDQEYYIFNLSESNELIFDSVVYDNHRPIVLLLKNDTPDTVIINYKSLISSKVILREQSTRYIKPGEYYSISPIFNQKRYNKTSILHASFWFNYSTQERDASQAETRKIGLNGNIFFDTLPEFQKHAKFNFPIAKNPIPIVSKTLNKKGFKNDDVYSYQYELRIYPESDEKELPKNIKLTYFRKGQEYNSEKRLDTLNQIYFIVPSELSDSINCIFSSSEYGFLAKKSFVRGEFNELKISFDLPPKLTTPHYYDISGRRTEIAKRWIGQYVIPFDKNDYKMVRQNRQDHIDSLNKLIKVYSAKINYGLGGYILNCKPENVKQVKKKLTKVDVYQLIDERKWVTNSYQVFFNPKISKERVTEIFDIHGIADFFIIPSRYGNNIPRNRIYRVTFKLNNSPVDDENAQIINSLLKDKVVYKIVQDKISFHLPDE